MTTEQIIERRFDRGAWLMLAFVMGFALLTATISALALRLPSDGCVGVWNAGYTNTVAACYGDWETPLRPGDEILAVGGVPLLNGFDATAGVLSPPVGWATGATVSYTVRRDRQELDLPVPIDQLSWTGVGQIFLYTAWFASDSDVISHYPLYLSAMIIFVLAPRNVAARLLLVAVGAHFAVNKLGHVGWPAPVSYQVMPRALAEPVFLLGTFWSWLFVPSLLLLVLSFPRRVWPIARWPRLAPALGYGVPLAAVILAIVTGMLTPAFIVLIAQFVLLLIALIAVPIDTFRGVRDPVARAQTMWMLLGLGGYFAPTAIFYPLTLVFPTIVNQQNIGPIFHVFNALSTLSLPVCLGVAILRYRLFDIEVIIRRTLVYTALTLSLAAIYFLGVVALQELFVRLTGEESTLAVVASTLAIAALFQPLRRRVQAIIDRRFFRKKYDAQQVLEQFARRAQQEQDLDAISADMVRTVQETLEPERVKLWLMKRP